MKLPAHLGSTWRVAVLVTAAATLFACDNGSPTPPPPKQITLKNLTEKSHVLDNIEYAYNKKQPDVYNALLDNNFTFFYTDAGSGTPVQWGRDVEVPTTYALFSAASLVDLDIHSENGLVWTETHPTPGETWFYTTVIYEFTIKIGDTTYIPNPGSRAQFTVRDTGPTGSYQHHWKLVEFRDLGSPSVNATMSNATEPTSWGQVKALYR
jgi:hypothetical protein